MRGNVDLSDGEWLEVRTDANERKAYRVRERLYDAQTPFQRIEILRLANQGRTLVLDGIPRVFEADEFIYHEALVHPAMRSGQRSKVLVIGDGDGGAIRELLKYPTLKSADWVEIDAEVLRASREHLQILDERGYEDRRLRCHYEDGVSYLRKSLAKYDAIFVTVTQMGCSSISEPFYRSAIYPLIRNALHRTGVLVQSLSEVSVLDSSAFGSLCGCIQEHFDHVFPYRVGLPSFGVDWGFAIASASCISFSPPVAPIPTRFYDEMTHAGMFSIPCYMRLSTS